MYALQVPLSMNSFLASISSQICSIYDVSNVIYGEISSNCTSYHVFSRCFVSDVSLPDLFSHEICEMR